ncbi:hypothetical protein M3664_04680 [Paenibacillus lautus]|uniref:hypothetical protein n=1 Tax=Paenibacillus lautus TaxID=1401 RepID=UPI00203FF761|nr:hypothetical protein [Paenibacillus lautus]MCM3257077.1 hypothetical protein [Paenibacillus lautus]
MRQTREELADVRRFFELPYLLDVIEVDKKKIINSDMIMKNVMVLYLNKVQDQANNTIFEIKQTLKKNGIKIIEQNKLEDRLVSSYSCRGYQHTMTLLWSKVKVDVLLMLGEYMRTDITDS